MPALARCSQVCQKKRGKTFLEAISFYPKEELSFLTCENVYAALSISQMWSRHASARPAGNRL